MGAFDDVLMDGLSRCLFIIHTSQLLHPPPP